MMPMAGGAAPGQVVVQSDASQQVKNPCTHQSKLFGSCVASSLFSTLPSMEGEMLANLLGEGENTRGKSNIDIFYLIFYTVVHFQELLFIL